MCIQHKRLYSDWDNVVVAGHPVAVPPFALLIWATLTRPRLRQPPPSSPRFPVAIDTGNSHNLYMSQPSARNWAGLTLTTPTNGGPGVLTVADSSGYLLTRLPNDLVIEVANGAEIICPRFVCDLWVLPNNDRCAVLRVRLDAGFALHPVAGTSEAPEGPSLPLLGGLALHVNNLRLTVNYRDLDFSLGPQV